jgi:hypothetical protein
VSEVAASLDIPAVTFIKGPVFVSCCGLWNLITQYLGAKALNRLNAIYVDEKMQLAEQLGKADSIPCKTTGIR